MMREADRDRAIRQQVALARELLKRADESAERDGFTHEVLTGASTRLLVLAFAVCIIGSFIGAALYHATLGG